MTDNNKPVVTDPELMVGNQAVESVTAYVEEEVVYSPSAVLKAYDAKNKTNFYAQAEKKAREFNARASLTAIATFGSEVLGTYGHVADQILKETTLRQGVLSDAALGEFLKTMKELDLSGALNPEPAKGLQKLFSFIDPLVKFLRSMSNFLREFEKQEAAMETQASEILDHLTTMDTIRKEAMNGYPQVLMYAAALELVLAREIKVRDDLIEEARKGTDDPMIADQVTEAQGLVTEIRVAGYSMSEAALQLYLTRAVIRQAAATGKVIYTSIKKQIQLVLPNMKNAWALLIMQALQDKSLNTVEKINEVNADTMAVLADRIGGNVARLREVLLKQAGNVKVYQTAATSIIKASNEAVVLDEQLTVAYQNSDKIMGQISEAFRRFAARDRKADEAAVAEVL